MDLLNWVDDCYKQQELSTSRKLPFELISRILHERKETLRIERQIKQAKENYNTVLDFFKQGLITKVPEGQRVKGGNWSGCSSIHDMWELYNTQWVEETVGEWGGDPEQIFYSHNEFKYFDPQDVNAHEEDDYFHRSFAFCWVGLMNRNLRGFWEEDEEDVEDERYYNNWSSQGHCPFDPIAWRWCHE